MLVVDGFQRLAQRHYEPLIQGVCLVVDVAAKPQMNQRWVRRSANFHHLAYKGFVDARGSEETGVVR